MGVKFGMEKRTDGPLHARFHPHQCNDEGIGPPKLEFLLTFDQKVEYKLPIGAYPLGCFHKICRVCTMFQDALAVKILLDLLKVSPVAGAAKNVEFFICLFVCLSVTLLNVRVCAPDFAMKALEYRNDFDTVG